MSFVSLEAKYSSMCFEICETRIGSVRRDLFSLHPATEGLRPMWDMSMEIIWWSDHGQGWIAAVMEFASSIGKQNR